LCCENPVYSEAMRDARREHQLALEQLAAGLRARVGR
jgi:hypothetical protein